MPSCFPGHTRIPFPKNNCEKTTHIPIVLIPPEQLAIIGQAGLLTCSGFCGLPLLPEEKVTIRMQNPF